MGVFGSLPYPSLCPIPIPRQPETYFRTSDQNGSSFDHEQFSGPNSSFSDYPKPCEEQASTNELSPHLNTVSYGPINVRIRRTAPQTLATGRRSKFTILEGDAAIKRDIRRRRNREAAKKLKQKRDQIERELINQIRRLESQEETLSLEIDLLRNYKHNLQHRCEDAINDERYQLHMHPFINNHHLYFPHGVGNRRIHKHHEHDIGTLQSQIRMESFYPSLRFR